MEAQPHEANQHCGSGCRHRAIQERMKKESRPGPEGVEPTRHETNPHRGVGVKAASHERLQPSQRRRRRHA